MKLTQLMQLTPQGVARAAARLQVVGFERTPEAPLTCYKAGFVGASRKLRKTSMVVNDVSGGVQVSCTCPYFESALVIPLAAQSALIEGTAIDRRNRRIGRMAGKPSLCAHLFRLAQLVSSPTALKRTEKEAARQSTTRISSRLKGL